MKKINTSIFILFLLFLSIVSYQLRAQSSLPIIENGVLLQWPGASGDIKIPDEVVAIADQAFYSPGESDEEGWGTSDAYSNTDITSVDFNQVKTVGKEAFKGCVNIKSIKAPLVENIALSSFESCSALRSVALPAIKEIANNAFAHCSDLYDLFLGKELSAIGDSNPFKNCQSLKIIKLDPENKTYFTEENTIVESLSGTLRIGSQQLQIRLSDKIKRIGPAAFYQCDSLIALSAPNCRYIDQQGLTNCSKLTELYLPHLEAIADHWMTLYQVRLHLLDVHLSDKLSTLHGLLADHDHLSIYVANEQVQQRLQKEFSQARIIIGKPQHMQKYAINIRFDSKKGSVDAWRRGAVDLQSGDSVSVGETVFFKALPRYGHIIEKWLLNGKEIKEGFENKEKTIFSVPSIQEDIVLEVIFADQPAGDVVFFDSMAPAYGSISCKIDESKAIKSADIVPENSNLTFSAQPLKGYRVTEWKKRITSEENGKFVTRDECIPSAYGKPTYACSSYNGIHILVDFDKKENHYTVRYSSLNNFAKLTAKTASGAVVQNMEALPAGTKIIFEAMPTSENIEVDDWLLNGETIPSANAFTYTIDSLDADVEINLICKEKTDAPEEEHDDITIVKGKLIRWTPDGDATLPPSVLAIGENAFEGANEMKTLTLNDKVSSIGELPFLYCTALESIKVPDSNPYFSSIDGVLYNKDKTKLIAYPPGKKEASYEILSTAISIQYGAFTACPNLLGVSVNTANTHLLAIEGALYSTDKKELLYYPTGFRTDKKGETALIDDLAERIAPYALAYAPQLKVVKLPTALVTIDRSSFSHCSALESLEIKENAHPSLLETIGEKAFYYCRSLKSIPYFSNLKKIENEAFAICDELCEVHIPNNTSMASNIFSKCRSIQYVYAYAVEPLTIDANLFTDIQFIEEAILYVPKGSRDLYAHKEGWSVFKQIKEFDTTALRPVSVDGISIKANDSGYIIEGLVNSKHCIIYRLDGSIYKDLPVLGTTLFISLPEKMPIILSIDNAAPITLIR